MQSLLNVLQYFNISNINMPGQCHWCRSSWNEMVNARVEVVGDRAGDDDAKDKEGSDQLGFDRDSR